MFADAAAKIERLGGITTVVASWASLQQVVRERHQYQGQSPIWLCLCCMHGSNDQLEDEEVKREIPFEWLLAANAVDQNANTMIATSLMQSKRPAASPR